MSYHLEITSSAEHQFKKLPYNVQTRISPKLLALERQPRPFGSQKLRDTDYYRIRIGSHRIIYSVSDPQKAVTILDIGHRREVYR